VSSIHPRAAQLIEVLDLAPHPEGGFFREIYRSPSRVRPEDGRSERDAATTIYFLLVEGTHSRWHRVLSDEVWHLYEGGPLELLTAPPAADQVRRVVLGPAVESDGPVHVVPEGWWQAARPLGAYVLAGCTVAPGFVFEDFSFLRDDAEALARITRVDRRFGELA
jgi:predicted cupin superfamily sugar epimerase